MSENGQLEYVPSRRQQTPYFGLAKSRRLTSSCFAGIGGDSVREASDSIASAISSNASKAVCVGLWTGVNRYKDEGWKFVLGHDEQCVQAQLASCHS